MKQKILLIDDEELVIKSICKLLIKSGYEVLVCRTGEAALEKVKGERPDLIVSDVRMPKMSGVETIKRIRDFYKAAGQRPVPEILITGYADEASAREAESLQVADYLYKPFDIQEFLSRVKKNLPGRP